MGEYIITVVICIFTADIAVLLMPGGSYKKYLKTIVGIIIMSVAISPIMNFSYSNFQIDFEEYFSGNADKYIQNGDYGVYEEHIREIYERNSISVE